jgi:hypothetical protein
MGYYFAWFIEVKMEAPGTFWGVFNANNFRAFLKNLIFSKIWIETVKHPSSIKPDHFQPITDPIKSPIIKFKLKFSKVSSKPLIKH